MGICVVYITKGLVPQIDQSMKKRKDETRSHTVRGLFREAMDARTEQGENVKGV